MKLLEDILNVIEKELFYGVDLEYISKEINYSKFHISKEFNTRVGLSIPEYIKLRRLSESAIMLLDENNKIGTVSFECGFNSVSYFSKVFKEVYDITPKEYQKGSHYINLFKKIHIGGKNMFKSIKEINEYLFENYDKTSNVNQLFANLDYVVLDRLNGINVDYFALLEEKKGNCLWECSLNLLNGIAEFSIIAHDKNNPRVSMRNLVKVEENVFVECTNTVLETKHLGKLLNTGKSEYLVDMCRIADKYFHSMEEYIVEDPDDSKIEDMKTMINRMLNARNDDELKEFISENNKLELLRLIDNKVILVYLINNNETFTVFDILLDLKQKKASCNYNSSFNNFNKCGTLSWNEGVLEIKLDDEYFAELRLGTGELYKLYNSNHVIAFENNALGLSVISFMKKR